MDRREKPAKAKAKAKRPLAGKAPKKETAGIHELEKRLAEALEQQTATAEILRVISSSPTDIQPVLDAVAESAARLCDASDVVIRQVDGDALRLVAHKGSVPVSSESIASKSRSISGRAFRERRTIHIHDVLEPHVREEYPEAPFLQHQGEAYRTMLVVPFVREDTAIGAIAIRRPEVRPFSDKQIKLLETFAAQAVIAIENVRLFNETKEALEQQTATAEILRIISGSPTDVTPVFQAVAERAQRICDASNARIFVVEGDKLRCAAEIGGMPGTTTGDVMPLDRSWMTGRAVIDSVTMHVADVAALPPDEYPVTHQLHSRFGHRTVLAIPLTRENRALGAILLRRMEVRPFDDRQIALLKTFADQAAIAIENVRLFNETKEALEQQTATAEILRVISSSPTNIQPVFDAILENATRLCGAHMGILGLYDGEMYHRVAQRGGSAEFAQWIAGEGKTSQPTPDGGVGRMIAERRPIHIADRRDSPTYRDRKPSTVALVELGGARTFIAVPMLKEGRLVGGIAIYRPEVRPFTQKQIDLVSTFANQAVIAIENVRLFNETREALEQQKASAAVLGAISSSIADTAPVFDKILESCNRLFAGRIVGLNLVGEDGMLHIGAYHGAHREEFERIFPIPVTSESGSGLSIVERRVVHYPDTERGEGVPAKTRQGCKTIGIKSAIFAPMLWEGRGMGAIFVGRDHVSSFSEKEIALLRTFADQAAIAIENVRLFNEIQEKSRQLEVASRHKSEFLANMSHELRTPLNAIIGFTRIVMRRSREKLEPQQYENLEKILASGQHLLALINSILDLAKVEAGRVEVNPGEIALAPVLEHCARTVEPLVKADAVTLVKDFDLALPQMVVDEEKLRQIVINLLSNAAKFTARGSIRLQAHASNGSVAIAVADTGIGIAPDKLEVIFEEFAQADASSTRVYGGTGLGLTIARRLARLMGGEITAESVPGSGSKFTLTLPLRYASPGA